MIICLQETTPNQLQVQQKPDDNVTMQVGAILVHLAPKWNRW
jgi:hypothetical protein